MKNKKIIILIVGIILITGATVVPIVLVNKNKEQKDKEDVEAIIKILKEKSIFERTIEIEGKSTGKIIADNKDKIIAKIKELIGFSKLRRVKIDISIKNDVDISTTSQPIIVVIRKNKESKKLNNENSLKVKRAKNIQEIKIDKIQSYLKNKNNLKLELPKNFNYNNKKIFDVVKEKLFNKIEGVSFSKDNNLITRKEGRSKFKKIAKYKQKSTLYKIIVGKKEFILKLNQAKYTNKEKINNDINEVERLLNTLSSKEVTIDVSSGSITTNKNSILEKIKALSGYSDLDLKGVSLSIKESDDIVGLVGIDVELTLTKNGQSKDISIFRVKRNKTQIELNQDDVDEIKKLLESLTLKEVTINAWNGSIKTNKNSILEKIQTLSEYPSDLKGVEVSIKEEDTEITLKGIPFILTLTKDTIKEELRGFTVKRNQSQDEINNDIDEVERLLNTLSSKEVTIDEVSGSIKTNKNSILEKIKALSGYNDLDLKGVSLSIKESDDIVSLVGIDVELTLTKNGQSKDISIFRVKRNKTQIELNQDDVDEIKKLLESLTLKEVTINAWNGSIKNNKNLILEKIQTLNEYPPNLKGVEVSIEEEDTEITLEGIPFILTLTKDTIKKELRGFIVKRSQSQVEINNDINEVERLLNTLSSKEVTIDEVSGSITTNKNSIFEKIKALSGYSDLDLKGVSLSIKESDDIVSLVGIDVELTLIKNGQSKDISIFRVKRNKTQIELNQDDVDEIKKLLEFLTLKEVTIDAWNGSIKTNKNLILEKIQTLNEYPPNLKGVEVSIKEEDTEITLEGIPFILALTKDTIKEELRGFIVKRSQSQVEINNDINEVERLLNTLSSKEVTIDVSSGSITTNKNSIFEKIKALSGYSDLDLKRVSLSIKESDDIVSLVGIDVELTLTKNGQSKDISIFRVKRNKTQIELNQDDVDEIKKLLEFLTLKEVTIDAWNGSIKTNKNLILEKIQTLSEYPSDLKGVEVSIKEEDTEITLEGIPFILALTKDTIKEELRGFIVKRSQSQVEINNDINEVERLLNTLSSKEVTIDVSSGSITTNKNSIFEKIKALSGYSDLDLKGVSLSIKESDDIVSLVGIDVELTLTKNGQSKDISIFRVKRSKTQIELNQDDVDEIKKLLESLTLKEVTIDAWNGSIKTNKNSILEKIQTLSEYPSDLKGVEVSIKEEDTEITLKGIPFILTLTKDTIKEELRGFTVKRNQSQDEINNDIDEVERLLNTLSSKEVTIDVSSGSITTNKNSILEKIKALSGYSDLDLKGVSLSIKESDDIVGLVGIDVELTLTKNGQSKDISIFRVKRNKTQIELNQDDVDEIKKLLESLTLKEVTIDAWNGSIKTNKNSILEKIQTLSEYPSDLKGVEVSIKEEDTEITLEGIPFILALTKDAIKKELRGFIVKRSQSQVEINNDINEVERLLNTLSSKEVTIDEVSGSITTNKNSILEKIKVLIGYSDLDLKGVSLSIKESDDIVSLVGIDVELTLTKNGQSKDISIFRVKRNKTQIELNQDDVDEIKKLLESLTLKEVTIDAWNGSIKTNKNSILEKIQTLSEYPSNLKGVEVSIKEEDTEITLEGIPFILTLTKDTIKEELRGFTVKRSQSQVEINNDINEVERLLNTLSSKEVTIDEVSGSITTNKNSIFEKIKALSGYSDLDLKGVSLSIKESDDIVSLVGIDVELTLTKNGQSKDISIFRVKRSKTQIELNQDDVDEIKKLLESLTPKEVTIDAWNGSIKTNKNSILEKIQTLNEYPPNLKGVEVSIKEEDTEITLEGIPFILTLTKDTIKEELRGFTVKRSQSQVEINNDINEVERLLNTLSSKEVTIDEVSGSITTNKNSILEKIKALSGYSDLDLKGVSLSIKESDDIVSLVGIDVELTLTKNGQSKDISIFRVKRNKTQIELNQDDVDEIKQLLESLTPKEVTIDAWNGSIKNNKNSILEKIQTLNEYPSDLKGVEVSIKEEDTEITLEGIPFILALTKDTIKEELRGFIVKRNQSQDEINNDINEVERLLNTLSSKEVTIDASSESITTNKNSILEKIKALSGYSDLDLKGVSLSIKESDDIVSLVGIDVELTLTKNGQSKDISIFRVKRSKTQIELNQDDVDEIKKLLESLTPKEVTIDAWNGSIKNNKNSILEKIQTLNEYPSNLKGVEVSIKEEDTEITLEGIPFILALTKDTIKEELRGFTVKRSQSQVEINNDINEVERLLNTLSSKEVTIDVSSGSITTNKNSILEKIKALSGYSDLDLKGVSVSIKESDDIVSLVGIDVELTLTKNGQSKDISIFRVKRNKTQIELNQDDVDEIKQLLESLTPKEVTIEEISGSIKNNKNSILEKIQTLNEYPSDLKGVEVSIKEEDTEITLEGIPFILTLTKDTIKEELRGFTVKRSQSQVEINNDINEVERLLNTLSSKEVIIDEVSGSITTNKNSILEKIKALSGYNDLDLKGVSVSIKESDNIVSLVGIDVELTLTKNGQSKDISIFRVKRSKTQIELNQDDVDEIKKLLESLTLKEVTIDAWNGSIKTNKNSILEKLQALSGYPSDLKGVEVSIKEEDTEITLEGIPFILALTKDTIKEELRGFIVKRSQTPIEKMKNNIKEYLKIPNNLNIFLPKDTSSDYDEDSKILAAIRKKLEILKPFDSKISKNNFDNLINKKQLSTSTQTLITKVATHDAPTPTSYEITIDGEDFTLQLKQNQYNSEQEKNKIINSIKTYLKNEDNLNLILPKDTSSNYDEDSKILTAIKTKLIDSIPDFKNYDANLIIKKQGSALFTRVANHDAKILTQYEITVDGEDFTLKLKQDKFTKKEKNKIEIIKTYLEISDNLNLILPKTTYDNDDSILEAIKLKLINNIENISIIDSYLIVKKSLNMINEVAIYGEASTQYEITIGENKFILNLNQEKFNEEEKIKIFNIKNLLKTINNLDIILPKVEDSNYDQDSKILNAIKNFFIDKIPWMNNDDFDNLITKKQSSPKITSIPTFDKTSIEYKITIGKDEFTLNLKQDQFTKEEKTKINAIKKHLEVSSNLNIMLPKTIYGNDDIILEAIKLKIVNNIENISINDSHLIVKKIGSSIVNEVATHGEAPTQYIITIDGEDFTLNLNKEEFTEDEKNVKNIKQSLESLNLKEVTIDAWNGSIKTNKNSILEKIQTLNGYPLDLKGVEVSIKDSSDLITLEGIAFTIWLSKGSVVNEELIGFIVKRSQTPIEKMKNNIKEYLKIPINLNIKLPKDTGFDYDEDFKILTAIRKQLEILKPLDSEISKNDFDNLITKKQSSTPSLITKVATHNAPTPTPYEITVDGEDFTLQLKQNRYTSEEERNTIINLIKIYLGNEDNLNFILPKDIGSNYDEDSKILIAIKTKLINSISDFKNYDANLIVKKVGSTPINRVANHDATTLTQYEITIDGEDFTLKLKQDKFTKEEKIQKIKTYLKTLGNSNIILPKTTYDNDHSILEAIKVKIVDDIGTISSGDSHLIVKKLGSSEKTSIATHGEISTQYEISIGEHDFILNLNQEEFSKEEKIINIIKRYLETLDNLNFILLKTTYDNDHSILEAIKVKLVNDIETISSSDSHLIVKKVGSLAITSVATHGETSTQYEISVGEHDFNLNLNQEEFSNEEKINKIQTYLEISNNLNIVLPKTIYDNDDSILEVIKVKLINNINGISSNDSYLIMKKVDSSEVTSVAAHSDVPTQYLITIGENEFTLKLNQEKFNEKEKTKINIIKEYLKNEENLNIDLPKDKTTIDYENEDNILLEIKEKLFNGINELEKVVVSLEEINYLIKKKIDSNKINSIPSYDQKAISYKITVDDQDFTLKLKQAKSYTLKTEIYFIKKYFQNISLTIFLPKDEGSSYDTDDKILAAIKKKLFKTIETVSAKTINEWIFKKRGTKKVTSISWINNSPTQYEITVDGNDYVLELIKKKYNNSEKKTLKIIQKYFKNRKNLNILLPKKSYVNDNEILTAIKEKLIFQIKKINIINDNLLSKKYGSSIKTLIANYDEKPTLYEITVGNKDFILNLNQEKFTKEERMQINFIKKYLNNNKNLNLFLPKNNYNNDNDILEIIKKKLLNKIKGISLDFDKSLITKKEGSSKITSVASYKKESTLYEITIDRESFILKLNQKKYNNKEISKNKIIQKYLENSKNLNIVFPKENTGFEYNTDAKILKNIRKKIIDSIAKIKISDFYLITKKISEKDIDSIPIYNLNQQGISYKILVGNKEFELKLSKHKNKIEKIKYYLKFITNTFKITTLLPKDTIGNKYNEDNKILEAIRKKIIDSIIGLKIIDANLINKKEGTTNINSIPTYGEKEINYKITVGGEDFDLKLKQEKYTKKEKWKMNVIKKYFEILSNLNLILPKVTYDNDISILEAIKVKLINDIEGISNSDSHLIIKKEDSSEVNEVATHDETPTQYIITIDEEDFVLKLNKDI